MSRRDRRRISITALEGGVLRRRTDCLAEEAPLEIHIAGVPPLVTMRTPGQDEELVAGLMFSEGVVRDASEIVSLRPGAGARGRIVRLMLRAAARRRLPLAERSSLASSACGICGKPSFSTALLDRQPPPRGAERIGPHVLDCLPGRLRAAQGLFERTGGLHAAGLFSATGELLAAREDVGRHNALDKLVGWGLRGGSLPWSDRIMLLSGRASYELLHKCVMAGVPVVCAISAPSSLAVDIARRFGVTLAGFLRDGRVNLYSAPWRVSGAAAQRRG